jgi:SAM-dependent methyltransferase
MFSQIAPYLGDEVLEAGCGIGNLTQFVLRKKRLVSLDIDPFYVDRIRNAYGNLTNLTIQQADITIPADMQRAAEGGQFDGAFCLNVIEHIEDHVAALKNFYNVLKPGGRAAILVPNDPKLYSGVDRTLGHCRRYTPETLTKTMEEAGFRVEKCWGFNRTGGFGWRVSGKILRKTTLSAGQMRIFELIMPLVKLAEPFPWHTHNSLIVVGVKPE